MKAKRFPNLKNISVDEILDYYDEPISKEESLRFIFHILSKCPETELNLVELFEQTP